MRNVLIVLDDVTSVDVVQSLLPKGGRFRILLTTRRTFAGVNPVILDVLAPPDSISLLISLAGTIRFEAQQSEAAKLCDWLGHLPLGLELVGRYLASKPDISLSTMLERLERKGLEHGSTDLPEGLTTAERGVASAFDLTWEELSNPAKELACLLSLFALAPIPWDVVRVCFPSMEEEELEDLRDSELLQNSLLQRKGVGQYQLHQLLQTFFRYKFDSLRSAKEVRRSFVSALISAAEQIPQQPTLSVLVAASPLLPHFEELVGAMLGDISDGDLVWPFVALQRLYEVQSLFNLAVSWAVAGLEATSTRFGLEHPDVARSLDHLAGLHYARGEYKVAEPLFLHALEILRKLPGHSPQQLATSLNNLALLYCAQGRYQEAEPIIQEALSLFREQLGPDDPDIGTALSIMGSLHLALGRYEEAERNLREALAISSKNLVSNQLNVARDINNLGLLYYQKGQYKEAEPLFRESLRIRINQLGPDHREVAGSMNNLASVFHEQSRYGEAESLVRQALEIRRKQLGSNHPDVALTLNTLAVICRAQKRFEEAERLYQQALDILRENLGLDHPDVAAILNNLAMLYQAQGRNDAAEQLHRQILEIRRKHSGPEHPDVAVSLNNLAMLYAAQGWYRDATSIFEEALAITERVLGAIHPRTQGIRANLESAKRRIP